MPIHVGYIVQSQNEDDDYTPYHGSVRLYRSFDDALTHAKELVRHYLETHCEQYDGPFDLLHPTSQQCIDAGSVVVFHTGNYMIWIDEVVE